MNRCLCPYFDLIVFDKQKLYTSKDVRIKLGERTHLLKLIRFFNIDKKYKIIKFSNKYKIIYASPTYQVTNNINIY